MDKSREQVFQDDIINSLISNGWLLGDSANYDRELALYPEDVIGFVKDSQPVQWDKFCQRYPQDSEQAVLKTVAAQLSKADSNASNKDLRKYGTLGVLRNPIRDRGARIELCAFKPDHNLNDETLASYEKNRLRVVPELVYSPNGYEGRIDLVLFVNGLPVVTLELKSEFKQSVENAIKQYKKDRLPKHPETKKTEPLLTYKRGALVHFAVSQYEVYMTTQLAGWDTVFLPFNKGTKEGGAGNETPKKGYATAYLWEEVLLPENLLKILGRFMHLQVEEKETPYGRRYKQETMIFPRYHQWDVVNQLLDSSRKEGTGHQYLIQHSAGSGKSNSIAWIAHQLSSLYDNNDKRQFDSVIVITDRTVLDAQLQDTIYQFEHAEGVVGRISREEGEGSKSEQLAQALDNAQPIIIVTIQTFPYVLEAIQSRTTLKERNYAIIADEAHSSQSGTTARKLREVLITDKVEEGDELSAEDMLDLALEARRGSENLSYYAFTATPKSKTLELFGRCPNPDLPPSDDNIPEAFHVYSMKQAIEEGFILDVLKNYVTYNTAFKLAERHKELDKEVDTKQASKKLNMWITLHPVNVGQRVMVIIEHYVLNIMKLLNGQARAMVVTGSRKEAVRYKLALDKYIAEKGYSGIQAMVAFSGDVKDPESGSVDFNEKNMNPGLKGRDMREAFDSDDYQIMIVANKFQTGFDQPKLCAMYVLKTLKGIDCVQTLSRLNRIYDGKEQTFILDFVNNAEEVREAFEPYYEVAELEGVSDPNLIYVLEDKLEAERIYQKHEVEQFFQAFYDKKVSQSVISNICKPAVERWQGRYKSATDAYEAAEKVLKDAKKSGNVVLITNAKSSLKEVKQEKDALDIFKKDLGSFVRFYEFMSQIIDYDDKDLEKLCLFARHLRPLLREKLDDDDIDLSNVVMTHYRLSKQRELDLRIGEDEGEYLISPTTDIGGAKPKDKKTELLSEIISRMNDLFAGESLTNKDMINYANTIADKVRENEEVMEQVKNNLPEQTMLGDFPQAVEDAVIDSMDVHQALAEKLLANKNIQEGFARLLLELLMK
ncbi:MAG: type I restriction endonuclease [Proteobacteria bacterium]|nr:type I restriction endonuclease [Pseudomonadota bacterium]